MQISGSRVLPLLQSAIGSRSDEANALVGRFDVWKAVWRNAARKASGR
jgi:hypothetical protein